MPDTAQDALARLPLFRELAPEQLAPLARAARTQRIARGTLLFQRGDHPQGFHVVISGQIKLSLLTEQGQEKVVELIGPGMSFGEAVMFLDRPYPVQAEALADSELLHVARGAILDGLRGDPVLATRMLAGLSARLHRLLSDLEDVSLHSARERVLGYLLRAADGDDGVVRLPAGKAVIASRLNLTPETFSRVLNELSTDGTIRVEGRTIHLLRTPPGSG